MRYVPIALSHLGVDELLEQPEVCPDGLSHLGVDELLELPEVCPDGLVSKYGGKVAALGHVGNFPYKDFISEILIFRPKLPNERQRRVLFPSSSPLINSSCR